MFPDGPCPKFSDNSKGKGGQNTNHVYSSPATALVVGEVVWFLLPYVNLTENWCFLTLVSDILMLRTCNFNLHGSSSTAGRVELYFERVSKTWVADGRSRGFVLQHFSRNSQTGSGIPSEGR